MTGTGCLSKGDVACKNNMKLMPKIWKLKDYSPECYKLQSQLGGSVQVTYIVQRV